MKKTILMLTLPLLFEVAQATNIFDDAVTSCNGDYAIWQSIDGHYESGDIKCGDSRFPSIVNTNVTCYLPTVVTIKVKKASDSSFYGYTNENGMNVANSYLNFTATAHGNDITVFVGGQEQYYSIDNHAFIMPIKQKKYNVFKINSDGEPVLVSQINQSGFNFVGCAKF
ncbi:hypothetical protein [Fangia hongkongensis]|uniref:hypothetical protein n=1 Tax=Fangia hongkongensis TaxID=270495 RepID=UPI000365392C|nr:hypothetical protein [Fangia hongkongensis]MBK2126224.1 hypothetical protein [Fangia hongkongensis]